MDNYTIRILPISEVRPGMVLGKMLFTEDKDHILSEGMELTEALLKKIKARHISNLPIKYPASISEALDAWTAETEGQKKFSINYKEMVGNLKNCFKTMRYFDKVPTEQMRNISAVALESMENSRGVINNLLMVKKTDDYTYYHSLNVSVVAGLLGIWVGYKGDALQELMLAGLLHDIGKTRIPLEILNKPGKLSDVERKVINLHPELGYNLIKDDNALTDEVKLAVLQHHERMNGKGYPKGLKGAEIHPFAKIIAVADTYDAMTSDRVYRQKVSPFGVVKVLLGEMFDSLDPQVCTTFLNNVRDYFLGNIVELSDGRIGEVVYLWPYVGALPVVHTSNGEFIDLERDKTISIVNLVRG